MKGSYRQLPPMERNEDATKLVIVAGLMVSLSVVAEVYSYSNVSPVNTGIIADDINKALET